MPALAVNDDYLAVPYGGVALDSCGGLGEYLRLCPLALNIELIYLLGKQLRRIIIVAKEQVERLMRRAHPAGGVYPRAYSKSG